MEPEKWVITIIAILSGIAGIILGYIRARQQIKDEMIELGKLSDSIKIIREGGEDGYSMYMIRSECMRFRNQCKIEKCLEFSKIQQSLADHSKDIQSFKNFAIWFLSSKEHLPLSEVTSILESGRQ